MRTNIYIDDDDVFQRRMKEKDKDRMELSGKHCGGSPAAKRLLFKHQNTLWEVAVTAPSDAEC